MNLRCRLLIVLFNILVVSVFGQEDINYQHKLIAKLLQKNDVPALSMLQEVELSDTVIDQYKIKGRFFTIDSDISNTKYIYIGRVNSCRAGGCSISNEAQHNSDSEYFDYVILFDSIQSVLEVKVFNYQATHGQEICAKGWLKQFVGYNSGRSLELNKDIDAISGATISVYAITFDVELKTQVLKLLTM